MSHVGEMSQATRFHVQVGLCECMVRCRQESEAVGEARKQMINRMPELGEIIRGISEKEFRVDRIG